MNGYETDGYILELQIPFKMPLPFKTFVIAKSIQRKYCNHLLIGRKPFFEPNE